MTDQVNNLLNSTVPDVVKRDHWGRYLLEDPTGEPGKLVPWTRATTISGVLNTTENLEAWKRRNVVFGMSRRPDLYAKAAAIGSTAEKAELNEIAEAAMEAAGGTASSNIGSAIHRFTERIDRGEKVHVPEEWNKDVEAYCNTMAEAGIGTLESFIERIVLNTAIRGAGQFDRIVVGPWNKPRIADVKTGQDLDYSLGEYAAQQAIYANSPYWWDPKTKQFHPMPDVDKQVALIIHIPAGQGRCELIELDIAAGWRGVQIALALRAYRTKNDLATPYANSLAIAETIQEKKDNDKAKATAKAEAKAQKKAEFKFPCEHCDEGYKTANGIKNHIERVHTPDEVQAHDEPEAEESEQPAPVEAEQPATEETPAEAPAPTPAAEEPAPARVVDPETGEILTPKRTPLEEAMFFNQRLVWVKKRVKNIVSHGDEAVTTLLGTWNANSPNVPGLKQGGPRTHEEIDLLAGTCNLVESAMQLEFFELDPAKQITTQKIKELTKQ